MKKIRLFLFFILTVAAAVFVLSGCNKNDDEISSVYLKDYDQSSPVEISVGGFDYGKYTLVVEYSAGRVEEVPLSEELVSESDLFKLYQVGEHEITLNYGGHKYTFKMSVKRAAFVDLSFSENNVFTYDGKPHTVELEGNIPANAVVTYIGGNSFVNVGTYDVTAIVSCEGYVTEQITTTVKIERARYDMSGVRFDGKEVVYDGNTHSLKISGTLPEGVAQPTYFINGKIASSASDVGEYTVTARFANGNPNYEAIPDMQATLKITPAEYTVKGVDIVFRNENGSIINDATKIYDGKSVVFDLDDYSKLSRKISVSFSVLDGDKKVISTSNKKTSILNAGVYTVKVEFKLSDDKNYQPIAPIVRTFEVLKADYPPLDNVHLVSAQTQYDGEEHSIKIDGALPKDVTVSYEYYLGEMLVVDADGKPVQSVTDAGRYTVKAVFTHNDKNCEQIPDISAILNVEKIKVSNSFVGELIEPVLEYSGTPYVPELLTWQEVNGTDYDVLQYGKVRYCKLDGISGAYVEMGENEPVKEVGAYRLLMDLRIADDYARNYCFDGGDSSCTVRIDFKIKHGVELPNVSFDGNPSLYYVGGFQEIEFVGVEESDVMTVITSYRKYEANGYTQLDSEELPTEEGTYKFIVTVTLKDGERYVFSNKQSSAEYSFDFVIKTSENGI